MSAKALRGPAAQALVMLLKMAERSVECKCGSTNCIVYDLHDEGHNTGRISGKCIDCFRKEAMPKPTVEFIEIPTEQDIITYSGEYTL